MGGLGVALQLVRDAVLTELPEADGQLGCRLRLLAGVNPGSWASRRRLRLVGAPTLAGPLSLEVEPRGDVLRVTVDAPLADAIEVVERLGAVHGLRSGQATVEVP